MPIESPQQNTQTDLVQILQTRTDELIKQPPTKSPQLETSRVKSAVEFMLQIHEGQTRKDKITPYFTHLIRVGRSIASWGGSEDEIIAGLLHDSLEDQLQNHPSLTNDIPALFGKNVYQIVQGYSIPHGNKEVYIEQVRTANDSVKLVVSLETFDNVVDLIHDIGISESGGRDVWERFGRPAQKVAESMIANYVKIAGAIHSQSLLLTEIHLRLVKKINQLQELASKLENPTRKFNPNLFEGTASFYAMYRHPYPPAFFQTAKERFQLDGTRRLLDIGTGTGRLVIPFAPNFKNVLAIDPLQEMIVEGMKEAKSKQTTNITWLIGTADDIIVRSNELGKFHIVSMGNVAHWLDLEKILKDIQPLVESRGGIVIVDGGSIWEGYEEWRKVMRDTYQEFMGERAAGKGSKYTPPPKPFELALADSPFQHIESNSWMVEEKWTAESILGNLLSTSYASEPILEEKLGVKKELFKQELLRRLFALNPENKFTGNSEYIAFFAKRK